MEFELRQVSVEESRIDKSDIQLLPAPSSSPPKTLGIQDVNKTESDENLLEKLVWTG